MTFGAGFLMRPLGAIVLGAYVDRVGRRKGLIVTLAIMAMGTMLIAFVPGYATIGLAAPALVLIGRLLQGFSAGVELGGVSVYLSEMAPPNHKGFYVSWQSGSQQVAIIVAAMIGYMLNTIHDAADDVGLGLARSVLHRLHDRAVYLHHPPLAAGNRSVPCAQAPSDLAARSLRSIVANWWIVLAGMMLVVMTTVSFYLITVYTPTFGKSVLKLSITDTLVVTFCVGMSNLFWLPVMGALSDRIGRRPILLAFTVLTILTAYPAIAWLVSSPSFDRMLMVELWLSFLYGSYNGAMVVALTEIVPAGVRTVGFSLCLQPRDRAVRRLHARGLDLADRGDRRQGRAGTVDDIRRHLRINRNTHGLSPRRSQSAGCRSRGITLATRQKPIQ